MHVLDLYPAPTCMHVLFCMLLQKGANPNVTGGELCSTPIHWATRQGHLSMVILLLRYGANPETLDAEGVPAVAMMAICAFIHL